VFKNAILDSSSLALDPKHNFKEIIKSNKQKILPKKFTEKTLEAEQKKTQALNEKIINSLFTKAISESLPVHLNAPFEEPLYNFTSTSSVKINPVIKNSIKKTSNTFLSNSLLKKYTRIMILVGCSDANVFSENLKNKISQFDNIVVLKETTSNLRHDSFIGKIDQIIAPIELSTHRDKIFEKLKPELLITVGGMIISKKIKTMLRNHRPLSHIHLGKYGSKDTFYTGVKHFKIDPSYFLEKTLDVFKCKSNYKSEWENLSNLRKESHKNYLSKVKFCDLKVFSKISEIIPENYSVQVSNSSAIRYMQLFDQNPSSNFNCNRGTSGIDGSTSTAIGASIGSKSPTLLISGDLSFLYDSNGLWNSYTEKSFRIVIINNSGGGIFKILPGYLNDKTHEKFIETRHNFSAKQLAKMHGFKYIQASGSFGLKFALLNFFKSSSRPKILEIFTDSSLSAKVLENYFLNLKKS
jgi:2-succinyl-5-enolpyruvyl-6-hydroxy-3-cyclohexene-1-carboxylate synthase